MTAGIIVYGTDGNFSVAHKTWKFLQNFDYDIVFSIGLGITSESTIKENFPNAKFYRYDKSDKNESNKNIDLIKNGFLLLERKYDYIIILKINGYMIEKDGYDFLYDCKDDDNVCGYRPIKLIGNVKFHVPDYFFMGKYENMKKLIDNLPDKTDLEFTDIIPKTLLSNELYVKDIGPFFNMEEVYNNVLPFQTNLNPYELKIKAAEWKQRN